MKLLKLVALPYHVKNIQIKVYYVLYSSWRDLIALILICQAHTENVSLVLTFV